MKKKTYRRRRVMRPRRRFGIARSVRYNKVPSFVETFAGGALPTQNAGGVLTAAFNAMPQWQQYAELYNQYRINWFKVILIPDYNSFQPAVGSPNAPRLVYAQTSVSNPVAPANEAQVLTDNGCRIRTLTRPVTITCKPVPYLQQSVGPAFVSVSKHGQWISTAEPAVAHGGIAYWIQGAGAADMVCRVYYKMSISLKDGN